MDVMTRILLFGIAILASSSGAVAQRPPAWSDDLVDKLVGTWDMQGDVLGRPAHHRITAQWVLAHHFLEVHEETNPNAPPSESKYDALWYLGYDGVTGHYVLHLMDLFGGRFSETLGNGTRIGDQLRFSFQYPDGPFRTSWTWHPESKSWNWHMEQSDKSGKWATFADFSMQPSQSH